MKKRSGIQNLGERAYNIWGAYNTWLQKDGFFDIAIASGCEDCEITILFQDITNIGTFLSSVKYSCKGFLGPNSIAIGDMNSDNFNDLIISEDAFVIRFQDSASPGSFLGRTKIYDPN